MSNRMRVPVKKKKERERNRLTLKRGKAKVVSRKGVAGWRVER